LNGPGEKLGSKEEDEKKFLLTKKMLETTVGVTPPRWGGEIWKKKKSYKTAPADQREISRKRDLNRSKGWC